MGLLDGKAAVITGAGRGLGKACAEVFVREGAHVLVVDVSGSETDSAAELGASAAPFHADVTREDEVAAMIDAAVDRFGRVDALVNVAGTPGRRATDFLSVEQYEEMTAVNLRGTLLCTCHGVRTMLESGGGSIVNISSVSAINFEARTPVMYMAAKAGIHALTKAVAVEYGPRSIRANVIAPGFTLSEKNQAIPPEALQELSTKAALGRAGNPREQGEVAAFLASDRASFVTGVIIPVDGGWSARLA